MARPKLKKKSVFIDMTAMSDVTVLLLTFFMLTSTFVKKEPVKVNVPSSVSEIKIPDTNILTILVDKKGEVFMSLDQKDMIDVLTEVGDKYNTSFTPAEEANFSKLATFGVPMAAMKQFLSLKADQQDAAMKEAGGIPCDSTDNQFKDWVKAARTVNPEIRIAIKSDQDTPYSTVKKVMNSLQDLDENRYNLITNLKVESAE